MGLLDFAGQLSRLGSILSEFSIYYDAVLAGNAFLNGAGFTLGGGGVLSPFAAAADESMAAPEPPAALLCLCLMGDGSAVAALAGFPQWMRWFIGPKPSC